MIYTVLCGNLFLKVYQNAAVNFSCDGSFLIPCTLSFLLDDKRFCFLRERGFVTEKEAVGAECNKRMEC
jgi:hypothetical protein